MLTYSATAQRQSLSLFSQAEFLYVGANDTQTNSVKEVLHHLPLDLLQQPSMDTKGQPRECNESSILQDITSAVPNTETAAVHHTDNESLQNNPQSPRSAISVAAVLPDTSATVERFETMQGEQATSQHLDACVAFLLQPRMHSFNQPTREHTPVSTSRTRSDVSSSKIDNGTIQPDSSIRQPPQKKRKKPSQHSHGEENDDERQEHGGLPKDKQEGEGLLFACPYFKHDRSRYGQMTYCKGKGWPNVARIKEHLYRQHRQPIHCPRCRTVFGEVNALTSHQREQPPCSLSEGTSVDGFNEAQKEQLKSRRNLKNMTEEGKWRQAYAILFPDVPAKQIPSPYYDPDATVNLEEVRNHLRQEILALKDNPCAAEELNALLAYTSHPGQVFEALVKFVDNALTNWPRNLHGSTKSRSPVVHGAGVFTTGNLLHRPDERATTSAPEFVFGMNHADHSTDSTAFRWPENSELSTSILNGESFLDTILKSGSTDPNTDHMAASSDHQ